MKIYYLEFENSVKFFRNDRSIEIEKSKLLEMFLKAVYKKYGKKVKFECLLQKIEKFVKIAIIIPAITINNIKFKYMKSELIQILNKYAWADSINEIKPFIEDELKNEVSNTAGVIKNSQTPQPPTNNEKNVETIVTIPPKILKKNQYFLK